jgi:hypothetical protein
VIAMLGAAEVALLDEARQRRLEELLMIRRAQAAVRAAEAALDEVRGLLGNGAVTRNAVTVTPVEAPQVAGDGYGADDDTADTVTAAPGPPPERREGKGRHVGGRPKGSASGRQRRRHDGTCATCGASFAGTKRQVHCSPTCRSRAWLRRQAEAADGAERITAIEPEPAVEAPTPAGPRPPVLAPDSQEPTSPREQPVEPERATAATGPEPAAGAYAPRAEVPEVLGLVHPAGVGEILFRQVRAGGDVVASADRPVAAR